MRYSYHFDRAQIYEQWQINQNRFVPGMDHRRDGEIRWSASMAAQLAALSERHFSSNRGLSTDFHLVT